MNTGSVGERGRPTCEARPAGQGFSKELARATERKQATGATDLPCAQPPCVSARSAPREVLVRRRGEADAKDDRLFERRDLDCAARLEGEERAANPQLEARADPLGAATLAAAVERLALALEHQRRAEGPSLEMQFGGRLRIRLTRGPAGLELAIAGDPATVRLARAQLPDLLAKLRRRGLDVVRSEVRSSPVASGGKRPPSSDSRVDARAGVR